MSDHRGEIERRMTPDGVKDIPPSDSSLVKLEITRGNGTTVRATRHASSEELPKNGYEVTVFHNIVATARFNELPAVSRILKPKGYSFSVAEEPESDMPYPKVIATSQYPNIPETQPAEKTDWRFESFHGETFRFKDLVQALSERKLIIADAADGIFDAHDNIAHRPFFEVVLETPGLSSFMDAVGNKAKEVLNVFSQGEDEGSRIRARKTLRYMASVFDNIFDTRDKLVSAIVELNNIEENQQVRQKNVFKIKSALREFFTHNSSQSPYGSEFADLEPDSEIPDSLIEEWTDQFVGLAEEKVAA